MKTLKLIAVDIDGVLLKDTYSPLLHKTVMEMGEEYTSELERNLFSRPREEGSKYFRNKFNLNHLSQQDMIDGFFERRKAYIAEHGSGLLAGVPEFMDMLKTMDARLVCYGGLDEKYIKEDMGPYIEYFEQYVCTNDFRPGLKEITKDVYNYEYNEVLFIDDVNTVAENARELNIPFIGVPSIEPWSWQKKDMIKTGVAYLVSSVKEIDRDMIMEIDDRAATNNFWNRV